MSTFGHNGVIKNPTFEHSQDPAHIAAGKVLEENGVRTSEQVVDGGLKPRTRIPLWLKLIVFLMFLIAVIALVFTLLMYSGKITPQTSNPTELLNSKASSPQSGFDISNKQLKQLIDELQQQVKDLEAKLNETKTMLENSIDETKKMSKTDNDALKAMLENSINKTKVMSKADDEALKALLENSINETKVMSKTDNDVLKAMLETSINETKVMSKTDNDVLKALLENSINETKVMSKADNEALKALLENNITDTKTMLQNNIDETKNMSKTEDSALEARLQKNINATIDKCMNVNTTLTDKIDTVSKMEGPRGFNGSQGVKGDKGDTGAGNLTQCVVKILESNGTAPLGNNAYESVSVIEETGKKILHFSCSSNNADIVESMGDSSNKNYTCRCLGQGNYNYSTAAVPPIPAPPKMMCIITYTECPLTS